MESKLARDHKRALLESTRGLTPQQRLEAFLAHCRLINRLYRAGAEQRRTCGQRP
jgi:hypothetical protein